MTDEVGVVTGELTLRTKVDDDGHLTLQVQYKDANEWYAVCGGDVTLPDPSAAEAVHELLVGVLSRGGPVPPGSEGWTPYQNKTGG